MCISVTCNQKIQFQVNFQALLQQKRDDFAIFWILKLSFLLCVPPLHFMFHFSPTFKFPFSLFFSYQKSIRSILHSTTLSIHPVLFFYISNSFKTCNTLIKISNFFFIIFVAISWLPLTLIELRPQKSSIMHSLNLTNSNWYIISY